MCRRSLHSRSAALTVVVSVLCLGQLVQAAEFSVATRNDVLVLVSKVQATQFLTHATFGGTQAQIDALATRMREIGTIAAATEWIDAQMALPASLHSPLEKTMVDADNQWGNLFARSGTSPANYVYTPLTTTPNSTNAMSRTRYRQHAWWHNVLVGEDQLRQKTAWALAQIFSVGENSLYFNEEEFETALPGGPTQRSRFMGLTHFYDIFAANAFGNYREIVGKVTYHSIMGDWLFFRGNRYAQSGIFPDESYALEVMRLFTIGRDDLFDDGSPRTDAQGVIPNYDDDDIREYSEVFTGLGYGTGTYAPTNTSLNPYSPYTGTPPSAPGGLPKFQVPMRMAPAQHDRSSKNLLNGLVLDNPNGNGSPYPTSSTGENQANAEIDAALGGLFAHRACPPFIVNRLIQRFVKSNPSKAFIARVVNVFKDNGSGVRGDLKAVIKAILLDVEAWHPIRFQYQRSPINKFIVTTLGTEDSRLQEPIQNYTRFTRFFKAIAAYQRANAGDFTTPVVLTNEFRLNSVDSTFDQSPYTHPSPFNFYAADYQPTGEIVDYVPSSRLQRAALFAPEFQIVNPITSNSTGNFFRSIVVAGTKTETTQTYTGALATSTQYVNTAGVCNVANESLRTVVTYDFSLERALLVDQPPGDPSGAPARIERLLEHLDMYLCGGTLSNEYKARLRSAIADEVTTAGGVGNLSTGEVTNIARGTIMAIVNSPSFLVTE